MTIMINVGRDFARLPIGRYRRDSKTSGEAFREDVLVPALNRAADEVVVVDLSEALGYGSSFLDEAFGGLVRDRGYRREDLRRRLRKIGKAHAGNPVTNAPLVCRLPLDKKT